MRCQFQSASNGNTGTRVGILERECVGVSDLFDLSLLETLETNTVCFLLGRVRWCSHYHFLPLFCLLVSISTAELAHNNTQSICLKIALSHSFLLAA